MDYVVYISTPVGKTEAAPLKTSLVLTAGRLTGGFLYFPPGSSGVLHIIAKIGEHQILPFNTGENYRCDNCVIPFHLAIDFFSPPHIIDIITWNDSTKYPHALTICFFLDPCTKSNKLKTIVKSLFDATKGYQKS